MNKFSSFKALLISFLIVLIFVFLLILKLIEITPNERIITHKTNKISNIVSINYNNIGIPQIEASNLNDLYFAIGYTQAELRMWQMDLLRRMAEGRLSEIFGSEYISYDKFIRFFDLKNISYETFQSLPNDLKSLLDSYSNGVNYFIKENTENLAIEFSIFDYTPNLWRPEDCILIFNFLEFYLNSSFKDNLFDMVLKEKLSYLEYLSLKGKAPNLTQTDTAVINRNFTAIPLSERYYSLYALLDTISKYKFLFNNILGNAFAIRFQTNSFYKSAIASDYAFELSIPSIGMMILANSPEVSLNGIFFPGIPLCITGKNNFLAWATDFVYSSRWYFEEIKLDANKSHFFNNDSIPIMVQYKIDTINVKNSYPRLFYLKFVKGRGLFTEAFEKMDINLIANQPEGLKKNEAFQQLYYLNFLRQVKDVKNLGNKWLYPKVNIVFGDRFGNIGITSLGLSFKDINSNEIKLHNNSNFILNPTNNFIISTNLPFDSVNLKFDNYRNKRIASFLSNFRDFEIRDIKNIQLDSKSEFAKELIKIIAPIIQDKIFLLNKEEKKVFESLLSWDYSYIRNQTNAVVLEEFLRNLIFRTLSDNLDTNQIKYFYNSFDFYEKLILILDNKYNILFDDIRTDQIENRDYIVFLSAKQTFQKLSKIFEKPRNSKFNNWGNYNKGGFAHFYHQNKLIGSTFSIDSIEMSGHQTCVNISKSNTNGNSSIAVINRIIFDSQYLGLYGINSLGNSGDPTNDHFSDQFQVWKNGGYVKINFDPKTRLSSNRRLFLPTKK